ncbi:MAG: FHA domain-containing protein [Aggregatilineales bacterium]
MSDRESDSEETGITIHELFCTRCGHPLRSGELVCSNCGLALRVSHATDRIQDVPSIPPAGPQQTGEAIASQEKPIAFELDGHILNLTIQETLIVGRSAPGEPPPDVDLAPYGAEQYGVSRRHLRITRRGSLIYITDLNSTNKTFLNGRRLIPDGDRLLRSDDEIRLGRLKIRVRF